MAKVSYSEEQFNGSTQNVDYKVGFFKIENGEEAIVRFAINSVDDFDIYSVHPITVGQSNFPNRRVSCLRTNPKTDSVSMCPLCARGEKVAQKIYIRMIQYVNVNGNIVPKAVIWERPAYSYARQLKSYLDNYGPLTNIICKISRTGEGLETRYNIIPNLNPQMYTEAMYPKNFSDFDDFSISGGIVLEKTFEEINQFIVTGQFPQVEKQNIPNSNPSMNNTTNFNPQVPNNMNQAINNQVNNYNTANSQIPWDVQQTVSSVPPQVQNQNPTGFQQPQMDRPVRYY